MFKNKKICVLGPTCLLFIKKNVKKEKKLKSHQIILVLIKFMLDLTDDLKMCRHGYVGIGRDTHSL